MKKVALVVLVVGVGGISVGIGGIGRWWAIALAVLVVGVTFVVLLVVSVEALVLAALVGGGCWCWWVIALGALVVGVGRCWDWQRWYGLGSVLVAWCCCPE
jgi:hypothetical protein